MEQIKDEVSEERLVEIALNHPEKLDDARLIPGLFTSPQRKLAMKTATKLRYAASEVTPVNMSLESKDEKLEEFTAKLQSRAVMPSGYDRLVELLCDLYLRRKAAKVCKAGYEACYDLEEEIDPVINTLERDILKVRSGDSEGMSDGSDMTDVMGELRWRMENPGRVRGMRFGCPLLEAILDGLHGGQLYIVGARPSVGKTAFITTMILNLIQDARVPAVFSLEMKAVLLKSRIVASFAGVPFRKPDQKPHSNEEVERLNNAIVQLQKMKWFYKDAARMDIDKICSLARRLRSSDQCEVIFVDYLQIIGNSRYTGNQMKAKVAENCNMLRQLAEELDVPVIVPAQLRRKDGYFDRGTKTTMRAKPELEDLKEAGDIEQDADAVLLMDRDQAENSEQAEIRVAKQRNGPVGTVVFDFEPQTSMFKEDELTTKSLQPL
jgi:replicative DNA helicase